MEPGDCQPVLRQVSAGLGFTDGRDEYEKYVKEVRAKDVDLVVVISELGLHGNLTLANAIPGVDVILSLDKREITPRPVISRTGTLIAEQGMDGRGLTLYAKIENPPGSRVDGLFVLGAPVDPERIYMVAFVTARGCPAGSDATGRQPICVLTMSCNITCKTPLRERATITRSSPSGGASENAPGHAAAPPSHEHQDRRRRGAPRGTAIVKETKEMKCKTRRVRAGIARPWG